MEKSIAPDKINRNGKYPSPILETENIHLRGSKKQSERLIFDSDKINLSKSNNGILRVFSQNYLDLIADFDTTPIMNLPFARLASPLQD